MNRDHDQRDVQGALLSLQELAAFELRTVAAETNAFGILRDRMSGVARFGENIPIKYQRLHYKTGMERQNSIYLPEGFPLNEGPRPLAALLVVDQYSTVALETAVEGKKAGTGQYAGERLYLSRDKKWILAERVGAYSEAPGSSSEWVVNCKALTDRSLLDHYSLETVTDGLFAATNRVWERLSPRMDAIRLRSQKVQQIATMLSRLGSSSPPESRPEERKAPDPSADTPSPTPTER